MQQKTFKPLLLIGVASFLVFIDQLKSDYLSHFEPVMFGMSFIMMVLMAFGAWKQHTLLRAAKGSDETRT